MQVLIAGGGTGGHLYPGIAVAEELTRRRPSTTVAFVGTARGLESRIVPAAGYPLHLIRSAGLKGKSLLASLEGVLLLPLSALDAWRVISSCRPAVVVGVGGYSSGPVLLLAALRGIPTLVMESNAVPGFTNRTLARWVRAAALSYDETLPWFPGTGFVTGNPVRRGFLDRGGAHDAAQGVVRVLIIGGSQGARAINDAVVAALPQLRAAAITPLSITHQTGPRDLERVRGGYEAAGVSAAVEPFFDDMPARMAQADIIVARAGASTIAELTILGRPALLVPLPTATDDHQRRNAEALARAGAAEVIDETTLTGTALAARLLALAADGATRVRMAERARALGKPDAAARIADRIEQLAGGGR